MCVYTSASVSSRMKAHRIDWGSGGTKNPQLTKKAAAAIPTPAARIEVILDGFSDLDKVYAVVGEGCWYSEI